MLKRVEICCSRVLCTVTKLSTVPLQLSGPPWHDRDLIRAEMPASAFSGNFTIFNADRIYDRDTGIFTAGLRSEL